jgi:hypothetical protein
MVFLRGELSTGALGTSGRWSTWRLLNRERTEPTQHYAAAATFSISIL